MIFRAGWLGMALINGSWSLPAQAADAEMAPRSAGGAAYEQTCATCHYDGQGNPAAPDLLGSAFWKNEPARLITMILRGQSGVSIVDGKVFHGEMPAMAYLSNEEIAAVTAYVFARFGGRTLSVEPSEVAAARSAGAPGGDAKAPAMPP